MALRPDVVLMDVQMPRCNGVEATRRLQDELPEARVIMLTMSEEQTDVFGAIKAGARGYILKNEGPDILLQAIHYVAVGGVIASLEMAAKLARELGKEPPSVTQPKLSPTEQDVEEGDGDPEERHEIVIGAVEDPAEPDVDSMVRGPVELVIAPPLRPGVMLKLQQRLAEVSEAVLSRVTPSWEGDTLLEMTINLQSAPLVQMLTEAPSVEHVSEEPPTDSTMPRRFRVVLKSD